MLSRRQQFDRHDAPAKQLSGALDSTVRIAGLERRERVVGGRNSGEVWVVRRHQIVPSRTVPVAEGALSIACHGAVSATQRQVD
jgi:hypothetical protein